MSAIQKYNCVCICTCMYVFSLVFFNISISNSLHNGLVYTFGFFYFFILANIALSTILIISELLLTKLKYLLDTIKDTKNSFKPQ